MIHYLTLRQLLFLYRRMVFQSGGGFGIRDVGALESALALPQMTFGGEELYPSIQEKPAVLGFALACNHPFLDGNKRIGQLAMEAFLFKNEWEILAPVDEQEQVFLALAAGQFTRESFALWVQQHAVPLPDNLNGIT